MASRSTALGVLTGALLAACEPTDPKPNGAVVTVTTARESASTPARDAAVEAPSPSATCQHEGNIESVERDPACLAPCDTFDARRLQTSLSTLSSRVPPGGVVGLTAKITNVHRAPVVVCLHADAADRANWDRVHGLPAAAEHPCSSAHFVFAVRTLDARRADVDALKLTPNVHCRQTYRVTLMPGRSLTKSLLWTAVRIPAPARPWEDDAGRRYVPKATPTPLPAGSYTIEVEVPFVDAPPELRVAAASIELAVD